MGKDVVIFLEHDTRKAMRKKVKKRMRFAIQIGRWMKQGYRLVKVEGDPSDPVYQQIQKFIEQHEETGKIKLDLGDIRKTASKVTGASVNDIKKKMDKTLDKWRGRFKGVLPE